MSKVIKIGCGGEDFVPLEKLNWFQEKLKSITDDRFQALKESLKIHGVKTPFTVWKDKSKLNIQDGHHRYLALVELKKEGWEVPSLPIIYSNDANKKEAAESILVINSRYAKMNEDSLSNYMIDFGLASDALKYLDIPDVKMDYFFPNDSLAEIADPEDFKKTLETADLTKEPPKREFEQIPTSNFNENVRVDDVKEEKMDVVGRRYVIIIDCKDQEHKENLKEKIKSVVEEGGAKFF